MKKLIVLIACIAMLCLATVPALAESSTSGASSTPIDVSATYKRPTGGDTIVCIDISWDNMNFTYTQTDMGTWLPGEHRYDNDTSGVWDTTSRSIEIVNHSNTPILSAFSFSSTISGMSGTFTHDYLWIETADDDAYRTQDPEGTYPAPSNITKFTIDPTSPAITESTRLGTITVAISTEFTYDFTDLTEGEIKAVLQSVKDEHISVLNITLSDQGLFLVALRSINGGITLTDLTVSGIKTVDLEITDLIASFGDPEYVTFSDATMITENAFSSSNIKNISVPNATSVGEFAFCDCSKLQSVSLPNVTNIEANAFENCGNLQSVSLPNATSIGSDAFAHCDNLRSVSLPNVTNLENNAFKGCSNLQSVSLPNATNIGDYAFQSCNNLQSVSLPEANTIGNGAFQYCENLQSISLPEVTGIGSCAFEECKNLQSVSLPELETVSSEAFSGCIDLQSVSFPKATTIKESAFEGCSDLITVDIPKVYCLEGLVFKNCTSLVSIELPSVTLLYDDVFQGCTALRSITFTKVFTFYTINGNFIDDATQVTLTLAEGQLDRDGTTAATAGVGATFDGKTFAEIIIVPKAGE